MLIEVTYRHNGHRYTSYVHGSRSASGPALLFQKHKGRLTLANTTIINSVAFAGRVRAGHFIQAQARIPK